MKKTALIVFALLLSLNAISQTYYKNSDTTEVRKNRFGLWTTPFKVTHVYGILFNIWPSNSNTPPPIIYGAELNLHPAGVIVPPARTFVYFFFPHLHYPTDNIDANEFKYFKKIYGLQLGIFTSEPRDIYGLDINACGTLESNTHGITISPIVNMHYIMNGLTFGLIGNHDVKCNGVQIGISNSCADLKGFQFGLWNRNQHRVLPLINWAFKSDDIGSKLLYKPQIEELLVHSSNPDVLNYYKRQKISHNIGTFVNIMGFFSTSIWIIEELTNQSFHSSNPNDARWRRFIISSTVSLTVTGTILANYSRKQRKLGLEAYNRSK